MEQTKGAVPLTGSGASALHGASVTDSTAAIQRRERFQILQSFTEELDLLAIDLSALGLTPAEAEANVTAFCRRLLPVVGEVGVRVDRVSLRHLYGKPPVQRTPHATVSQILQEDGVRPHLSGYTYLCDAILIVAEDSSHRRDMMGLYNQIALQHKTTASRVGRGIRHAVGTSEAAGDQNGRLPNSMYIARVAERLRNGI